MRNRSQASYDDENWDGRVLTEADYLVQTDGHLSNQSSSPSSLPRNNGDAMPTDPDADDSLQQFNNDVIQPSRKWIVEPIALMFAAAMLSQMSVTSQYLYFRVGQHFNETVNSTRAIVCDRHSALNSTEHVLIGRIQHEASRWTLYRNVLSGTVALLVVPLYASASDYMGRRPALLLPCVGMAVDSAGLLLVLILNLPLQFLVISGGLGALGGGFGALFAAMFSYVADTTSRKSRPLRVAIVEGTFGVAGVAMEVLIGWWMNLSGYLPPMIFSAALTLANLLYAIFLVPEVRPPKLQRKPTAASGDSGELSKNSRGCLATFASPYINIAGLFGISGRLSATLGLLLGAICVYSCSFMGVSTVSNLYMMNFPFCLDSVLIGYVNAAKIVCLQVGVLVGLLVFRRFCGVKPLGLTIIGLASAAIGFLATGFAPNVPALFAASAIGLFSMLPLPMLRAFASQVSPPNRQGALFSCIGVLEVAGGLAGTASLTVLYGITQRWLPGFVYLVVAGISLFALLLSVACSLVHSRCCTRKSRADGHK